MRENIIVFTSLYFRPNFLDFINNKLICMFDKFFADRYLESQTLDENIYLRGKLITRFDVGQWSFLAGCPGWWCVFIKNVLPRQNNVWVFVLFLYQTWFSSDLTIKESFKNWKYSKRFGGGTKDNYNCLAIKSGNDIEIYSSVVN